MMKHILWWVLILISVPCFGETVIFQRGNFTNGPVAFRAVKITPLSNPSVGGNSGTIENDWDQYSSDASGFLTVSNMARGSYTVECFGPRVHTSYQITVPGTNDAVTLYATNLITTTIVNPSAASGYSQASADARFYPISNPSNFTANALSQAALTAATNAAVQASTNFTMTASNLLYLINVGMTNAAVMASTNFTISASNALYSLLVAYTNGAVLASTNYTVGVSNSLFTILTAATNAAVQASTNYTVGVSNSLSAAINAQKYTNSGIALVDKNGSDATAILGVSYAPSLTVSNAAYNVAMASNLVLINPGLFTGNNLLRTNVNYEWRSGAIQTYTQAGNDAGWGFMDDRPTGPTTNVISFDRFVDTGWTNRTTNAGVAFNANTLGTITVTNPATKLFVDGNSIELTGIATVPMVGIYSVYGTNSLLDVHLKQIIDPFYGSTLTVSNSGVGGSTRTFTTTGNGIWAGDGDGFYDVDRIVVPQYGFYGLNNLTGGTNHWYQRTKSMIGKVYLSCTSSNYTYWADILDLRGNAFQSGVAWDNTGGKGYLIGERVTGSIDVESYGTDYAWSWVSEQKEAATNCFVRAILGHVWNSAMDYEDIGGTVTNGFYNEGAYLWIANGGDARVHNGKGITHNGGTTVIDELHVNTSDTDSTNNNPVFVASSGLTLHNVVATAPASAFSLSANSAQTVKVEGFFTANTAISPVISFDNTITNYAGNVQIKNSFIPPTLTKTQRNAISGPMAGMVVYQTDNTPGLRAYNGTHWVKYTETNDD